MPPPSSSVSHVSAKRTNDGKEREKWWMRTHHVSAQKTHAAQPKGLSFFIEVCVCEHVDLMFVMFFFPFAFFGWNFLHYLKHMYSWCLTDALCRWWWCPRNLTNCLQFKYVYKFFFVVCDLRWLENLTIALIYDVSVSYGKSKISWWFKQLSMCIEEEEKEEERKNLHTLIGHRQNM